MSRFQKFMPKFDSVRLWATAATQLRNQARSEEGDGMTQGEMIAGTTRNLALSQWFTPPELAQRVVEWAGIRPVQQPVPGIIPPSYGVTTRRPRVLEPSAGNCPLVRPLVPAVAEVTAIELDPRYTHDLAQSGATHWTGPSFLGYELGDWPQFDLCVMNPPYEGGLDVAFVLHALEFAPRVVGIFRSALLHGATRKRELWSRVRPTRIAFLADRPKFGEGNGARSDFIVTELVPLRAGGPHHCAVEVW
jgi:predicted RNA methylase